MARLTSPSCKQCRRLGDKLFLKGERCYSQKCAMVKRPYAPGAHGKSRRRKVSEYGQQLAQKQHVKRIYGVLERQFKNYFEAALKQAGDTRQNLMVKLEMRLDNVIFRSGLVKSRPAARQMVSHRHILVSGRPVNVASFQVKAGQTIALKERDKEKKLKENLAVTLKNYQLPSWLALDLAKLEVKVLSQPAAEDLGDLSKIGLIVESYSR